MTEGPLLEQEKAGEVLGAGSKRRCRSMETTVEESQCLGDREDEEPEMDKPLASQSWRR